MAASRDTSIGQRLSSEIVKIIFHEFAKSDTVHFCYPHSEAIYPWKEGAIPPPVGTLPYPVQPRMEGTSASK